MLVGGLVILVVGGELLVRGAVSLARALGVSPLMIGLTLVGFGTSTPELVTSLKAAFAGAPGVSVGNVVGSNIANVLLILGVAALISPVHASPAAFRRDGPALALATLAGIAALVTDSLTRGVGAVFVALLAVYVVITYMLERTSGDEGAKLHEHEGEELPAGPTSPLFAFGYLVVGIGGTLLGASLLVDAAIVLARDFGVSDAIIGLTIVAVGTSLPELVTAVMAALKGESDVAFGNIVGSNIYNILAILGITALIHPIPVAAEIVAWDVWVMLAATVALIVCTATGWRVCRREGALLLGGYGLYLWSLSGAI